MDFFNISKIRRKTKLYGLLFALISFSGENLSPCEEKKCPCKAVSQLTRSRFQTHLLNDCALSLTGAKEEGKRARGGKCRREEAWGRVLGLARLWPLSQCTRTGLLTRGKAPGSSTLLGSWLDPPLTNSFSIFFHWERQGVSLVPSIQKACVCGQAKRR